MAEPPQKPPKVFISYSWTSDDHIDWVVTFAERLMSDRVEVILDQWNLNPGQDKNVFMEKMVQDPTVDRVLVVCESGYAKKANERMGGVGTETQIISPEVYNSVNQTKFIPVLRERDENGKPHVPIYFRERIHIDFSDLDKEATAYDELLRNIFNRPLRAKPPLGETPSYLFNDDPIVITSAQKAKRFREVVKSGKGNALAAFDDFVEEFLLNFNALRMTYSKDEADTWCERIHANIQKATSYRDIFVECVMPGVQYLQGEVIVSRLLAFLERLLPFQERPDDSGAYFRCSEDNYKLLCYELFLYTFAMFVKAKKYSQARELIEYQYVASRTFGGDELESHDVARFNVDATSLEECGKQGHTRRHSVMADVVRGRANNKHVSFSNLLQADVLLCIACDGWRWCPRCLVFGESAGKLELFARAVTEKGFGPLREILGIDSPQELLQALASEGMRRVLNREMFLCSYQECLNLRELKDCWGA